ncbi:AMP-binding protein [Streptomyces sp. NPDC047002]|uniref:AMP-binding protein n=1 Tax=Streptomyces sp. NPDC047002 TaxID=3155475 RepID=UPI00345480D0
MTTLPHQSAPVEDSWRDPAAEAVPLPVLLRERAAATPDAVFVEDTAEGPVTYGRFEELVHAWRGALHAAGVRQGDRVATMFPTGPEALVVWMAVARLGAVEVPLNTAYHGRVLATVLADAAPAAAAVHPRWAERFAPAQAPESLALPVLTGAGGPGGTPGPAGARPAAVLPPEPRLREHTTATVVYTSGTTGRSKGVLIPWRQLERSAVWCIPLDEAGPGDHWYVPVPLFHVSGKLSVYAAALTGARAVTRDGFSTSRFWPDVRAYGCTTTLLPGSAARYLESVPPAEGDADNPLRNVFVAPFPRDRAAFAARFGVRLTTAFNMTEVSCPVVSGWELGPEGSCGRVRPGAQIRIVDAYDREVEDGETGELLVRTDSPWEITAGYLGLPEATAAATRNLWFHTGDRCRRDADGWVYFVDRSGDAIRRRGENICSTDVEAAIGGHPAVAEAAVVGVPSEWGEHDVKAFVVAREGHDPDGVPGGLAADIAGFARRELPRFMVPRYVEIVDDLPRTHTQRVRKAELRARTGHDERPGRYHDAGR